ncbi:MAG TPA: tRNA (adenosine(37)-N6)-threonylcarbamoyltransferase complex dimerization subunit type 1 TsaB [Chloroflexi bacterium]|nr:tRNA (adenosine(37)-N6)-threonylcarbamoyltransferase complex dimerization subunit type 1 TsaB [Chloroflexota bacterium]
MTLLAIDTATERASIALHDGMTLRSECTWEAAHRHTVTLVPKIVSLLAASGMTPQDVRAIAVCNGPGSYTGVRIGVAVAKGMAVARKVPLVGITTLDILAAAQPKDSRPLYALYAAGRKRVGYACYRWRDDRWTADGGVQVVAWSEFVDRIELPSIVVGELHPEGREALRPLYGRIEIPQPAWHLRRAGFLADLAWVRLRASQTDAPSTLLPLYTQ